jgi:ribA/ribD-fused uncharacterized protein
MKAIDQFKGKHRFLSSFSPHSVEMSVYAFLGRLPSEPDATLIYPTAEHAFHAHKTRLVIRRRAFTNPLITPGDAKRNGRKLKLRPDWEDIKLDVMYTVHYLKYYQHDDIRERLINTGDAELIEGNTWGDRFWGCTMRRGGGWHGENHLGIILMQIREDLRNDTN